MDLLRFFIITVDAYYFSFLTFFIARRNNFQSHAIIFIRFQDIYLMRSCDLRSYINNDFPDRLYKLKVSILDNINCVVEGFSFCLFDRN